MVCLSFFVYIPRSNIAGRCWRSIPDFLRKHKIDFQSGSKSLHTHQQCNFSLGPHPHQHKLLLFWILTLLRGVRWNLKVALVWIFLISNNVEPFVIEFWVIIKMKDFFVAVWELQVQKWDRNPYLKSNKYDRSYVPL